MAATAVESSTLAPFPALPETDPREEWHKERRKGVGSSDAPALFNEGYSCNRRLVYDKRGNPPDFGRTEDEEAILERGQEMEEIVALRLQRKIRKALGYPTDSTAEGPYIRRQPPRVSKSTPIMRANMDRQFVRMNLDDLLRLFPYLEGKIEGDPGPGYVELKTANEWAFKAYSDPSSPQITAVNIQVQHGLYVTDYRWAIIGVMQTDNFDMHYYAVLPNLDFQGEIVFRALNTWQLVVDPNATLPPQLDIHDKRCGNCQWRKTCRGEQALIQLRGGADAVGVEYEEDDSLAEMANDWKKALFTAEDFQAIADQIKEHLKVAIGDRTAVAIPSAGVKILYKGQKGKTGWDSNGLKAEFPTIARHVAFATWVRETHPDLVAEFCQAEQENKVEVPDLTSKFQKVGAPSRPFRPFAI